MIITEFLTDIATRIREQFPDSLVLPINSKHQVEWRVLRASGELVWSITLDIQTARLEAEITPLTSKAEMEFIAMFVRVAQQELGKLL